MTPLHLKDIKLGKVICYHKAKLNLLITRAKTHRLFVDALCEQSGGSELELEQYTQVNLQL